MVSCGLLRSGEGSGITIGWAGTSVVVGTSGEGAVVVGVESGSPSAGGTSVDSGSFEASRGSSVSEIGVSVKDQSPQHSLSHNTIPIYGFKEKTAHHSVITGRGA